MIFIQQPKLQRPVQESGVEGDLQLTPENSEGEEERNEEDILGNNECH